MKVKLDKSKVYWNLEEAEHLIGKKVWCFDRWFVDVIPLSGILQDAIHIERSGLCVRIDDNKSFFNFIMEYTPEYRELTINELIKVYENKITLFNKHLIAFEIKEITINNEFGIMVYLKTLEYFLDSYIQCTPKQILTNYTYVGGNPVGVVL